KATNRNPRAATASAARGSDRPCWRSRPDAVRDGAAPRATPWRRGASGARRSRRACRRDRKRSPRRKRSGTWGALGGSLAGAGASVCVDEASENVAVDGHVVRLEVGGVRTGGIEKA